MKAKELRGLSDEELAKKERDMAEDRFKLKFQHGIRQLDDTAKLGQLRKDMARVKTIINHRRAISAAGDQE
ncbi:MAG: 50S ribosomal protein L29 [Desulfobulbaceae bacterium]|nr:50S ribosomal protein L29 [Desulfobulbaceae bacterium]